MAHQNLLFCIFKINRTRFTCIVSTVLRKTIENIQVIITCTDKIKLENKNILIYNVKDGKVKKENQEF